MIIGFEYHKLFVERKQHLSRNIKINHNLSFDEVKEIMLQRFNNKPALDIRFQFKIAYEPDVGVIDIHGSVVYTDASKLLDQAVKMWKDEKKLMPEVSFEVINAILMKCNVKALELSDQLNLPAHVPLPQFKGTASNKFDSYIG